jgi:hypothetical protein
MCEQRISSLSLSPPARGQLPYTMSNCYTLGKKCVFADVQLLVLPTLPAAFKYERAST